MAKLPAFKPAPVKPVNHQDNMAKKQMDLVDADQQSGGKNTVVTFGNNPEANSSTKELSEDLLKNDAQAKLDQSTPSGGGKKKRKVSKRKVSKRKTSKRKASRRKASRRKTSRRKTSRRKTSRRKTSKRKASRRKTSRRKTSRRKTSRRKTSRRKALRRRGSRNRRSKRGGRVTWRCFS